ncbi:bifunctional [glutamine synthetase] adenylyltransferase/[glutamine synthetase]-adenylyl-L-tyrosine phosphorylase [Naumannella halotolerans]|uniref:Glutamate-ammonia-ligase adenylyltransferase n=1 Tax=Naumannella halotolerans TaxID=993414 RepID=A0A4R7J855_9ACTN|nr:bifunctional [glutamine synthetase] adenylyltransferase/[glutamine synthetase]-adenylyl-L-tyrosine phosphorylase [Naumannella halotolerans]TDT32697.1 glutamate-ammonia-ligase adenylyltransferase [Naumannella halotolerans]
MARVDSIEGRLARGGFLDPEAAVTVLKRLPVEAEDWWLGELARAGDPDKALAHLERLIAHDKDLVHELCADKPWARRLIALLGASDGAANDLAAGQPWPEALAGDSEAMGRPAFLAALTEAIGKETTPVAREDALRVAYRVEQLRIAGRDLTSEDPLAAEEIAGRELADLADAAVEAAFGLAREEVGPAAQNVRLGIVALGKTGGQELNYVSDVDVLFVAEPVSGSRGEPLVSNDKALQIGSKLASAVIRICSANSRVGQIFPLDAALRPEGKAGPLVRTMASHRAYYESWAKNWEFQAMLKVRAMAGDLALAQEFEDMVRPLVWAASERPEFLAELRAMRRRVVAEIPAKEREREIKLGAGGLRDVEFTVQLLQLVHGRADERIRWRGTLPALNALIEFGYVGREDGNTLAQAYRFLRALEHRVQLVGLRRTHLAPATEAGWRRVGRTLRLSDPAAEAEHAYQRTKRLVLSLHERLFYSPLLEAVARIPTAGLRLTASAARQRLRVLGYADPDGALRHIAALTNGLSRKAEINRQLLPAMLGWMAETPFPDHGLLSFRQVSEDLGNSQWYLRTLRDDGVTAYRLATVLGSSRYLVGLLRRDAKIVQMLGDDEELVPRDRNQLDSQLSIIGRRHQDPAQAVLAFRGARRKELFRIGAADLLGQIDSWAVARALSDLTAATIHASLQVIVATHPEAPSIAVLAMGRWGGREMSYASDADAVIVMGEGGEAATKQATAVVSELRQALGSAGPEPGLEIDLDLRPDGKSGPLVRSLEAYRSYYEKRSAPWEAQALVRADLGAGDQELAERTLRVMDARRWPAGGLSADDLRQIRRLKDRMETERLPRGDDPKRHLKLGPGGLSDVEWVVQLVQLQHAHDVPELRTPMTLRALRIAREKGLVPAADAMVLREAWMLAGTIRNKIMLVRGRRGDVLPSDPVELAAVAELMGMDGSSHLVEHWAKVARRSRRVFERLFYGEA